VNDNEFLDLVENEIEHISFLMEDIISNATMNGNKEEAFNLISDYRIIAQMLTDNFMNGIQGSDFVRYFKFSNTLQVRVLHDNKGRV
jgi:hypothetical protein